MKVRPMILVALLFAIAPLVLLYIQKELGPNAGPSSTGPSNSSPYRFEAKEPDLVYVSPQVKVSYLGKGNFTSCEAPVTNLDGFRNEILQLANRVQIATMEGDLNERGQEAASLINTVIYGRDCWELTLEDMGVTEEFWRNLGAIPLSEIPKREKP